MPSLLMGSFCLLVLAAFGTETLNKSSTFLDPIKAAVAPDSVMLPATFVTPQLRSPDTPVPSQPGAWPQLATKRQVDFTQLKAEAQELQKLTEGLPAQIDRIQNNVLPKELIETLKKIEKLSKHIRGEVT